MVMGATLMSSDSVYHNSPFNSRLMVVTHPVHPHTRTRTSTRGSMQAGRAPSKRPLLRAIGSVHCQDHLDCGKHQSQLSLSLSLPTINLDHLPTAEGDMAQPVRPV